MIDGQEDSGRDDSGRDGADGGGPSEARRAEVARVVETATRWARGHEAVAAALLAGSWARGAARADSDVDLLFLTADPAVPDFSGLVAACGFSGPPLRVARWGPVVEHRFRAPGGTEVEVNLGPLSWAATDPVDAGTRRVVTDGCRILHDPDGLLAALLRACAPARP
ncbi:nucleotidyltransferase domain-containing protein [Streptomyces sp. BI20]|uniref:nucleotidyltransferase domain-containing protein n=1 Tax=Streptomyces sp. BI20 TaxID=3403460 RepID=UPI003C763E89